MTTPAIHRATLLHDLDEGIFVTLRAIADTYEEEGNEKMAEAYRWMADNRRAPLRMWQGHGPDAALRWKWSILEPGEANSCLGMEGWPSYWIPRRIIPHGWMSHYRYLSEAYAALAAAYRPVRKRRKARPV